MTIGLVYQMEYFYGELPGKTSQRTSPHSSPKDTTEEEKEKKKIKIIKLLQFTTGAHAFSFSLIFLYL